LFEAIKVINQTLARNLTKWLNEYGLRKKFLIYVKDERSSTNVMIIVLKSIMSCEGLGLWESFQNSYFDHDFSKACQYVTINDKVCQNF
jgi:hypothetical protein